MAAVLSPDHIQPVIDDLERIKDVRKAFEDLRDSESRVLHLHVCGEENELLAFVNYLSPGVMHMALQALETAIALRLAQRDIQVKP